jgi:glutamate synthase (NADPH/NADH) small chain
LRTSMRMGADDVKCVYRRSHDELPARGEEIHHAEQEGIQFFFLHNPIRFIGNEQGWVEAVELQEMKLGEPDDSGRRRPSRSPVPPRPSPAIMAVIAVGSGANPLITSHHRGPGGQRLGIHRGR